MDTERRIVKNKSNMISIYVDDARHISNAICGWINAIHSESIIYSKAGRIPLNSETLTSTIMRCGRMKKLIKKWLDRTGDRFGWIAKDKKSYDSPLVDTNEMIFRILNEDNVELFAPWVIVSRPHYTEFNDTKYNTIYLATNCDELHESAINALDRNKIFSRNIKKESIGVIVEGYETMNALKRIEESMNWRPWQLYFNCNHGRILELLDFPHRDIILRKRNNDLWNLETRHILSYRKILTDRPADLPFFLTSHGNDTRETEIYEAAQDILNNNLMTQYSPKKTGIVFPWAWSIGEDGSGTSIILRGRGDVFSRVIACLNRDAIICPI